MTRRIRALGGVGVLIVILAGCGSSKPRVVFKHAPSASQVSVAMEAKPRLVETIVGGTMGRAVVDAQREYLALFSPSGRLIDMDKNGFQYFSHGACYQRIKLIGVTTQILWAAWLTQATAPPSSVRPSGDTFVYRSLSGSVTVDAHTRLIRAAGTPALPRVPASSAAFSYPSSISELPTPTPVCG